MSKKILIITGESSGELYGSLLAKEIFKKDPSATIKAVGGMKMKEAGVELIAPINSAFGITEAIRSIISLKNTLNVLKEIMDRDMPDGIVLIDYPDFNFKVAQEAKKRKIPVLYYVSPQVWAWRPKRVFTISKIANILALILPFERNLYKNVPIRTEFVGHPVFDEINIFLKSLGFDLSMINNREFKASIKEAMKIKSDELIISLLPGSRKHEVLSLMPSIVESARYLINTYKKIRFVMAIAINLDRSTRLFIEECIIPIKEYITVFESGAISALSISDFAIVASGTASFQSAILNVPMVVIYKVSPITFFIGRLLVNVKHIALSNVIIEKSFPNSDYMMVKELMQKDVTRQKITDELGRLINDTGYYQEMLQSFEAVRSLFVDYKASERVADLFFELIS